MTKRESFVTSLAVLGAVFNRPLPPEAIEGYWLALSELSEADFAFATKAALQTSRWMPPPAELLDYVRKEHARATQLSALKAADEKHAKEMARAARLPTADELRELAMRQAAANQGLPNLELP